MKGRIYLVQDSANAGIQRIGAAIAPKAGQRIMLPLNNGLPGIRWDPKTRVPWIQPDSEKVDEVCGFFRTVTARLGVVRVIAELEDELPLVPLAFDGMEGVYGNDIARGRVTGGLADGTQTVRVEVQGGNASMVADLYASVRSGEASRISGWRDEWKPFDLRDIAWDLVVPSTPA